MKFIKEITPKGLLLPVTAARLAGFNAGDKVEYHTLDGAMLVLKGRMSAPELLAVVQQLTSTSAQLLHHLSEVCGPCEDCDKDSCPYNDFEEEAVQVNEYLREAAGIPDGAKLCAEVDEEAHTITVLAAEHRYDLRDLPADLLETFMVVGACLGRLEEQYLPDWAREKLEELRTPQQEQDTGPAMGGMNME